MKKTSIIYYCPFCGEGNTTSYMRGSNLQECSNCGNTLNMDIDEKLCPHYEHEYAEKICPHCGIMFCYTCCGGTNVDQGGKYDPDYMNCPNCGHDYYQK